MTAVGTINAVVLDCPDPWGLASFWSEVTGLPVADGGTDEWVELVAGAGGWQLAFQRVAAYEAPSWPDGVPQQAHLDVSVPSLKHAEAIVLGLGAKPLSDEGGADSAPWRVYADPAGHPFCLCTCR